MMPIAVDDLSVHTHVYVPDDVRKQFEDWTVQYEKSYDSLDEHNSRLLVFHDNLKLIEATNAA
jgi:hypothetical protein